MTHKISKFEEIPFYEQEGNRNYAHKMDCYPIVMTIYSPEGKAVTCRVVCDGKYVRDSKELPKELIEYALKEGLDKLNEL